MKTIYSTFLSGICILLLYACYDDKGNYNYKDINEVKISGLTDQSKYTNIDHLIVEPTLDFSQNPNGTYTYEWSARSKRTTPGLDRPEDIIIGQEKNLDYFVTLPSGQYTITLKVTDAATNLTWSNNFTLNVATSNYMGWMVLCDENGLARLDMVEESGDEPLYSRNFLALSLPTAKHDPWKMEAFTLDLGGSFDIFMLTGDGCTKLVSENLSYEESNDFKYLFADLSANTIKAQAFAGYAITGTLLVGDNNLYWRKQQGGALFGVPVNVINGQTVKVAPYIGYKTGSSTLFGGNNFVLFDKDNLRFIKYYKDDLSCSYLDNFPKGKELVFMQNCLYQGGTTYAILRDPQTDVYSILPFDSNNLTTGTETSIDIPDIQNIKLFAFDPLYPYLFYSDGKQIFLYSWTESKPENKITPMQNFPNETITMLKYNISFGGVYSGGTEYPDKYLLVGTENTNGTGSLRLYEAQPNREQLKDYKSYSGFARIIDATYRER